ncbi:hypothetical protein C8F04DRAFT_1097704 [Mycena alexandri]|uniref:Wings apart-like protein C-terminal domain-containing protein n=1 Tax=Mycena alexandri TaxID=1745969 RepID=A0AAD6T092_9AGAR|nr:hypothetical protein C8F04DRAFT_1097704 [Mycena alexandri]
MPSTSFNSRTYSRKAVKRKDSESIAPEAKRKKYDQDEGDVSTDVEEDPPAPRPRTPRDLSQIFEAVTPSTSSSPSPGKLAKRMLSRSKTESSIASGSAGGSGGGSKNSSTSSIFRTPSLPDAFQPPRNAPQSPGKPPTAEAKQSPVPRPKISGRTYAGNSRSFLVPIPVNPGTLEQLQEELDDEFASRESYTSLRTRWGVDESEDDPYAYGSPTRSGSNVSTPNTSPSKSGKGKGKARAEPVPLPNGMMNPLKSITELRNQGESRRFLDEVGYLWEGLDKSGGLGLRRASALEITTKLCESEFARKAKASDFIGPTWDLLRTAGGGQDEDRIMDILLAFFAALVARDPASLSDLAQRASSSFTSTLFSILGTSSQSVDPLTYISDAAQLRKLGFSKKDQNLLTTIHTSISSSSLFPRSTKLSTPLLTSHTLTTLPPSSLLPTPGNLKALLASLKHHLTPLLASPMATFMTTSLYNDPHINFSHIHNALSLIDTYLLAGWSPLLEDDLAANQQEFEDARDTWLPEGLVALGVYIEAASGRDANNKIIRECSLVNLRLLVGLTHSDKIWCSKLTKSEFCFGFILRAILRGHSARLGKGVKDEPEANVKREVGMNGNGNGGSHGKRNGRTPVKVEAVKKEEEDNSDEESEDDSGTRDSDPAEEALDTLCLALGLLTNLVQVDDRVKDTLRETYVSLHCTLPKCLTACRCAQQITALEALARMYAQLLPTPISPKVKLESSPEPEDASVLLLAAEESRLLLSHLSLLFGLLMMDNPENQATLLPLLPEPPLSSACPYDGDGAKVDVLVGQAREFVYIYSGVEGGDAAAAEEGEGVRAVLRFMEALRER